MASAMGGGQDQQPDMGEQAVPGMPGGATAYPEKGQEAPSEGVPAEMQSPLTASQSQAGYNVLYLARRAATYLEKLDESSKQMELMKMRGSNPNLFTEVQKLLMDSQGSQTDPLNPLQSPLPEQKPSRRQNPIV